MTPPPRAHPPTPAPAAARPVSGPLGYAAGARVPAMPLDPSMSMPIVARRPWRLIVIVLLIDLGLAATGVWLLTQGLSAAPAARPTASGTP